VSKGRSRLTKAELLAVAKEQDAQIKALEAQLAGDQSGVMVVESIFEGDQRFPDVSDREKPDLVVPPYEKVVVDERWINDPGVRRAIAAGRLKGPFWAKERPEPRIPVEVPESLRLTMPLHDATVQQILMRPLKEMERYITMTPRDELRKVTDVRYLKTKMVGMLRNALYRLERGEGLEADRQEKMRVIKQRIDEIEVM